jgi:hypothetical protein
MSMSVARPRQRGQDAFKSEKRILTAFISPNRLHARWDKGVRTLLKAKNGS